MRIQGGNVDPYRTLESAQPTPHVAASSPTQPAAPPTKTPPLAPSSTPSSAPSSTPSSPEPTFFDRVADVFDSIADAVRGIGRAWRDALVAPSRGFLEITGSILLIAGKTLSALQSLFSLEPAGRRLNEAERALAQDVFGSALNLDEIRIKPGRAGLYSLVEGKRPFVMGSTIYTNSSEPLSTTALLHVLLHVHQYQHHGAGYLPRSLMSQALSGASEQAYDFASQVARGASYAALTPEQQAELVAVAYQTGAISAARVARPFVVLHEGRAVDCTPQLRAALAALAAAPRP